ncbi:hypothetical protein LTR40_004427 [Exophiala xenobiotica]|nr:hypothetical protein LTR40_004427 [Exophiala xenobiotica]
MDVSTPQNPFDDRENNATESTEKAKSQRRRLSSMTKSQARSSKTLACLSCRPRKIKCERVDGVCERCRTLEIPCTLPDRDERRIRYSKDYIVQLESQIADLRSVVADLQRQGQAQPSPPVQPSARHMHTSISSQPQKQRRMSSLSQSSLGPMSCQQPAAPQQLQDSDASTSPSMATEVSGMGIAKAAVSTAGSEAGESLITRLCGAQGRLNSKNDGQLRYFGPTSSLHLTESVTSIFRYCNDVAKFGAELEKDIPWAMQQYLLDLYWKYQHNVLLIIHKEAFLAANLVQDYSLHHGNPNTLMGSALYNITMAATIFVADIAEKNRQNTSITKELTALTACLEAMKKMESAEIVARNVRKIVQTIMRVCGVQNQGDFATNTSATRSWQAGAVADLQTAEVPMNSTERDIMDFNFDPSMLDALQFPFEEVLMDPLSANDFLQL